MLQGSPREGNTDSGQQLGKKGVWVGIRGSALRQRDMDSENSPLGHQKERGPRDHHQTETERSGGGGLLVFLSVQGSSSH